MLVDDNTEDFTQNLQKLSDTATKIALQNFEWRYVTLLFFNSTMWCGVESFLRSYDKVVVIGQGTFCPRYVTGTRQYVLFGSNNANIVHTLEWMRNHEFDNTGKYIIICQSQKEGECDEEFAVRKFWQYKITNVVYLKSFEKNVSGYTYFPLSDAACDHRGPVKLDEMMRCLEFQKPCNVFPVKLRNLNSCKLIASTFIQPPYMDIENGIPSGVDGDFIRLLAEKLNASLVMMTPRVGFGWGLYINGTWDGSFGDIYNDYANLSITSPALTTGRYPWFHLSTEYATVNVVWITHAAKEIPSSLKLAYPFQEKSRIALSVSFAFVIISAILMQSKWWFQLSRRLKMNRPKGGMVFYSWMICMGLPTTRLPKKTALLYVVLLWIWYGVLIRTFYQASLMTTLKNNYYYREVDNLYSAIEDKYPFGGGSGLKVYYLDDPVVHNQWEDVSAQDIIPTLRKLGQGMEFVLAMNLETAKTIIWKEQIHVHILTEKVVTSPTSIFFKKFSPLCAAVNSVIVKLIEGGFFEKFYRDHTSRFTVRKSADALESIKLSDYAGCYALLLAGWSVSCLAFVTEILLEKVFNRQSTLRHHCFVFT